MRRVPLIALLATTAPVSMASKRACRSCVSRSPATQPPSWKKTTVGDFSRETHRPRAGSLTTAPNTSTSSMFCTCGGAISAQAAASARMHRAPSEVSSCLDRATVTTEGSGAMAGSSGVIIRSTVARKRDSLGSFHRSRNATADQLPNWSPHHVYERWRARVVA